MESGLFGSTAQTLSSFWDFLNKTGPAANLASLIGLLVLFAGYVKWYVHRKLDTCKWRIHLLEGDLEQTQVELARQTTKLEETEARSVIVESRLPETALVEAQKQWADHNYGHTNFIRYSTISTL